MSSSGVESLAALRPALLFLRQVCGYQYLHAQDAATQPEQRQPHEAILAVRLLRKMQELNPDHSLAALQRAVDILNAPTHAPLAEVQQQLYQKICAAGTRSENFSPGPRAPSSPRSQTPAAPLRYFDFENPAGNEFLVIEQFQIAGPGGMRTLDAVIFVNGIPLAVFEARATDDKVEMHRGVKRLQQMQAPEEISRLFHTVLLLVVLEKYNACYGGVGTRAADFKPWENCAPGRWEDLRAQLRGLPARETDLPTPRDALLAGIFSPQNLLTLLRDFAGCSIFTPSQENHLPWCHQFHALQLASARLHAATATTMSKASGTIVHPHGTGKSHTLLWLACKLKQLPAGTPFPVLILTERPAVFELFRATWKRHRWSDLTILPKRMELLQTLQRGTQGIMLASPPLQWYQEDPAPALRQGIPEHAATQPLWVLVDEMTEGRGERLLITAERVWPQAAIVAFTAFLPSRTAPLTARGLQNVIHRYSPQQAQREGLLVPAFYEERLPQWKGPESESAAGVVELDADHSDAPSDSSAPNTKRLRALADDIGQHYDQDIAPNGNLALLTVADATSAASYREYFSTQSPAPAFALFPAPSGTRRRHKLNSSNKDFEFSEHTLQQFAASEVPALLIVAGPLPWHFSLPRVQAVYVDRPMAGRELLEATALTQCAHGPHKTFGLVVDYCGSYRAVAGDQKWPAEAPLTQRYHGARFEELQWWRRELLSLCGEARRDDYRESDLVAIAAPALRAAFAKAWTQFARRLDQLLPQVRGEPLISEARWWNHLRQEAAAFYLDEALEAAQGTRKLSRLFEEGTHPRATARIRENASIYGQDFWQELEDFETPAAKLLRLQHVLYEEFRRAKPFEAGYYAEIEQRVHRILAEHELGRMPDAAAYEQLRAETARLRVEKSEGGASPNAQPLFELLQKFLIQPESNTPLRRTQQRRLAHEVLTALAPEMAIVDWAQKEEVQREMRQKIKRALRRAQCSPKVQEELTWEIMKLLRARASGAGGETRARVASNEL